MRLRRRQDESTGAGKPSVLRGTTWGIEDLPWLGIVVEARWICSGEMKVVYEEIGRGQYTGLVWVLFWSSGIAMM
ncbi:hypothetical protein M0R45_025884 [Rubus argutus]|uniref:Uncharacterized protein n=1 Tax=Rubus argutus TaxID=59490 RepID=A0AAW1WVH9_RUBAR